MVKARSTDDGPERWLGVGGTKAGVRPDSGRWPWTHPGPWTLDAPQEISNSRLHLPVASVYSSLVQTHPTNSPVAQW